MKPRTALIIGAGPAGLTAAYELLTRTDIIPIVLEQSHDIGGISKTVNYKGNRIDIGGHRFFSKSDRVMNWWLHMMPLEKTAADSLTINYQNQQKTFATHHETEADASASAAVLLVRSRQSRIYYLKKFFRYPVTLSGDTIKKLGLVKIMRIGFSYLRARIAPIKNEQSLEDFFINRFGKELYLTFFKDYTEKVWGTACKNISAEWGAQRIKELSVSKALWHAVKSIFSGKRSQDVAQKNTETSLIERFLYPKLGPGQMWETVADNVSAKGAQIHFGQTVTQAQVQGGRITSVTAVDKGGKATSFECDYVFSTMALQPFIAGLQTDVPPTVKEIAAGLQYRDFMIVGLLLRKLAVKNEAFNNEKTRLIKDNWIYIQESEVKIGRLQVFNNWSPFMVSDPDTVWLGLEYFCNQGDALWSMEDEAFKTFAAKELAAIGIIDVADVLDSTIIRMEKTYPAYFGTYDRFEELRRYLDGFENLYCIGRNGMHKYNNSDHSMLTAMTAVDNIVNGVAGKENIWSINTEQEYHEETAKT
jgi:protoporphyrinogen oxidase